MTQRGKRKLIMSVLALALVFTSVAYAILQTTLSISGTVTRKGGSWNIYFTNLTIPTKANGNLVGEAASTNASINVTDFSFNASLTTPGDSITYYFDVKNEGTIDAVLSSIVLSGVEAAKKEDITYKFTYKDGTTVAINDTLKSGETKNLKVVVSYDNVSDISESSVTLNLGATLIYTQTGSSSETLDEPSFAAMYTNGEEVYFDPETGKLCRDYKTSQSNAGVKTGCMKWYVYNDNGTTLNLFLDHNTTNAVAWQSSGDNRDGIGEVQTQLESDTSTWQDSLGARLITYDEINSVASSHDTISATAAEIIAYSLTWYAGYYWTSTPLPSSVDTKSCGEYYSYAYSVTTASLSDEDVVLLLPNFDNTGGGCANNGSSDVTEQKGVRPVITVTR